MDGLDLLALLAIRHTVTGRLLNLGITLQTVPLSLRERVYLDRDRLRVLSQRLIGLSHERMVLSTCERVEVFGVCGPSDSSSEAAAWMAQLAEVMEVPAGQLSPFVRVREGLTVARHLLRVAAGLESRIVGEPHILGQLRTAFLNACESGETGAVISALGRSAIHTGKRVHRENAFRGSSQSIVELALAQVERDLGCLRGRSVVIMGSGALATDLVRELGPRRPESIAIVSRDRERAISVAARLGVSGFGLPDLARGCVRTDALIACTASPSHVVDRALVNAMCGDRLSVVDLGVPRNVDPVVASVPGVSLTHLDQLVGESVTQRVQVAAAKRIVEEELDRLARWLRERRIAPTIAKLVKRASAGGASSPVDSARLHLHIKRLKASVAA